MNLVDDSQGDTNSSLIDMDESIQNGFWHWWSQYDRVGLFIMAGHSFPPQTKLHLAYDTGQSMVEINVPTLGWSHCRMQYDSSKHGVDVTVDCAVGEGRSCKLQGPSSWKAALFKRAQRSIYENS